MDRTRPTSLTHARSKLYSIQHCGELGRFNIFDPRLMVTKFKDLMEHFDLFTNYVPLSSSLTIVYIFTRKKIEIYQNVTVCKWP